MSQVASNDGLGAWPRPEQPEDAGRRRPEAYSCTLRVADDRRQSPARRAWGDDGMRRVSATPLENLLHDDGVHPAAVEEALLPVDADVAEAGATVGAQAGLVPREGRK